MKEKNRVAFLTLDWTKNVTPIEPNGCAYYRCYLPGIELAKLDWTVAVAMPEYNKDYGFGAFESKERIHYGWDIIVFKLIMLKSVRDILETARPNQKIVVDVDDFYEGLSETNLAYQNTDPEKHPENNREHYWAIIDMADAIITSTQFLYDYYTKEKGMKNVYLVRNAIDIDRWRKKQDYSRWLPTVGWVGAIPWRSGDLETMNPFLGKFLEKNRLSFHHSGHIKELNLDVTDLAGIPKSVKFTNEPRKILSKYPEMFRKIDIGLVPLNNLPFNHAKSTIKGLEYTAAGVPFIASWSPEYELLESQGVGRVARNQEEWEHHLNELLNPSIRKQEIEKNYENVRTNHSMSARAGDWDKVMQQILDQ
jgi:glycosyltransferase involved in cell wall biosynthesis